MAATEAAKKYPEGVQVEREDQGKRRARALIEDGNEPTYADNQALSPGDRAHLEAASDERRAEGRDKRAEEFAARFAHVEEHTGYVDPKATTAGTEGVYVTHTPAAAEEANGENKAGRGADTSERV